jgi:hypothetical protein
MLESRNRETKMVPAADSRNGEYRLHGACDHSEQIGFEVIQVESTSDLPAVNSAANKTMSLPTPFEFSTTVRPGVNEKSYTVTHSNAYKGELLVGPRFLSNIMPPLVQQ